ncbi:MAG: MoaD/ThiS family protein [Pseudochelatococcus sp.]|jgi:molybdopterin converting factor small subunit|uniref:MoaD/ThiS family protein n=1 Tax=Pseudochelatococcus sp. TaxID=2020869 RepID=UPI003D8C1B8A
MSDMRQEASVTVLFFGRVSDRFGRSLAVPIPVSGMRIGDLRGRLETMFGSPAAPPLLGAGTRAAVDKVVASDDTPVFPGQEIAFFSAVSGG